MDQEIKILQESLQKNMHRIAGEQYCRKSAVAIPLIYVDGEYHILFEVRSLTLKSQPGDICFPGGRIEMGEKAADTVLREVCEELYINIEERDIICELPVYHSSNQLIQPYAVLLREMPMVHKTTEVDHIFTVPLSYLKMNAPECYPVTREIRLPDDFPVDRIHGGAGYPWSRRKDRIYFYSYKEYWIWGITAYILHDFLKMAGDLTLDKSSV